MKKDLRLFMMTLLCAVFSTAWAANVTDVLTRDVTGVTGSSYAPWSDVKVTSDAVYAGQSAGGNESIQLRSNNNNSGIVTTASGGAVKTITVTWNSNTAAGRTLNIYGNNTAYTSPADLYNTETQGTLLGTIVNGESTTLNVEGDYAFIGMRSNSGAMYLEKIEITWDNNGVSSLKDPELSFGTTDNYTINFGESFTAPTLSNPHNVEVAYSSSNKSVATVSENGSVTILAAGTTIIRAFSAQTGTYKAGEAKYTLTVLDNSGIGSSADKAYTVAQARTAIDNGSNVTGVYAKGIVSKIVTAFNEQYGNISYNISDDGLETSDQLQAYRGKSFKGENFTSADDIQVGDVVVVYGNLTKYNSTYEFAQDNQLVSLDRTENNTPVIKANNTSLELAYDATSGEITYSITHPVSGKSLKATADANWISNIAVSDDKVTFSTTTHNGSEDRTATITLSYEGAESVTVSVTQKFFVSDFATLPFAFDGGRGDINSTAGLTHNGLGSDYNSSPKLKFDTTGDELVLKINERPGILSFDIKGNSFSDGTFTLQVSTDGNTYTDVESYTTLASTQLMTISDLNANVRYIKWIYTEKSAGNVALGNIKLAVYGNLIDPQLSFEKSEYTANLNESFTAPTLNNPHNVTVSYSSSNGKVATVDASTGKVTLVGAGETTITAISAASSTYSSGSASYKLTVTEPTIQTLANIAALSSQTEAGNYGVTFNNVVVTYVNGNYAYLKDASGAIVLYNKEHGLTAGQVLNGKAEVTYQLRNGNPQITSLSDVTPADGTAPEPTTVAASSWSTPIATVLSQYFKVTGATITQDGNKFYVKLGSENVQLYGQGDARNISVPDLNVTYTIIGFPTLYVKDDITTPELQIFVQPEAEGAVKPEAGLSYGEDVSTVTITIGEAYTLPTLINPNNVPVTYSSSDTNVATIDASGKVTPKAKGQTTIKATFEGNNSFLAGEASYTLIVKEARVLPEGTFFYETFTDLAGTGGRDGEYTGTVGTGGFNNADGTNATDETWASTENSGAASQCAKLGTGSKASVFTTGVIKMTGDGTLSFEAAGWGSGTNTLKVTATGATLDGDTEITLVNGEWNKYTVSISGAQGEVVITFAGKRGFIDEIKVAKANQNVKKGDANGDGKVDISDVLTIVDYKLDRNPKIIMKNSDLNGDKVVDLTDALIIVDKFILFRE